MRVRRNNWSEPGAASALLWLAIDDHKGNPRRQHALPPALYSDAIAPFLHFDMPLPNQLYVIGGRNQQQGPLDTVELFDTWHGRWVTCPNMSMCRAGCGAAVLPDWCIMVTGGYDENGIVKGLLASCEIFNPWTQTWSSAVAPLQHARWGHGCTSLRGLVYAVGGCSLRPGAPPRESFMETLKSCEVYDPAEDVWLKGADLHMARAGSRVVAIGENLLAAVGGCDDVFGRAEMLPTVEIFDAIAGRWSLLDAPLSMPRTTAAVAVIEERHILVVGGAPSLSTSEVYRVPDSPNGASRLDDEATSAADSPASHSPATMAVHDDTSVTVAAHISNISEGRMGCQAAALKLPAPGSRYPMCTRTSVVIVGGENGEEDWEGNQAHVRQFGSILVYDTEGRAWRPEMEFPLMLMPRTAMALCVGHGQIRGHSHTHRNRFRGGG
mmetsp:Transcript_130387/g.254002  ORF Transcript_130387/g.254002 Transcript_130387/m.254002 type:complete len:438 (-) Transcript_130387:53-1366(-)